MQLRDLMRLIVVLNVVLFLANVHYNRDRGGEWAPSIYFALRDTVWVYGLIHILYMVIDAWSLEKYGMQIMFVSLIALVILLFNVPRVEGFVMDHGVIRGDGKCGPSWGGAICAPGQCCSEWGLCGNTDDYCVLNCASQCTRE